MFKCKPPLTSANLLQNNRIEMKQALLICFNHPQVISDLMLNLILKTLFLLIFIAYIGLWNFSKEMCLMIFTLTLQSRIFIRALLVFKYFGDKL